MAGARILIVDDDPGVAGGLQFLLEQEGMTVHVEPSLITLPFVFRRFDPDLVLLDLGLPGLSGRAYFQARARRKQHHEPPAVLYSGRPRRELVRLAEEIGADGCISKEEYLDDILSQIRSLAAHGRALKSIQKETDAPSRPAPAASHEPRHAERDRHRVA